jgi:hypothetical protein
MPSDKLVLKGLQQWDGIKLAEVWSEFCWYLAAEGVVREDMLSERNAGIYHQLRNELLRRGMQLRLPHGSWSS